VGKNKIRKDYNEIFLWIASKPALKAFCNSVNGPNRIKCSYIMELVLFLILKMGLPLKLRERITNSGFTVWRSDAIHAIFKKPASSNLFSAAADLDKEERNPQIHWIRLLKLNASTETIQVMQIYRILIHLFVPTCKTSSSHWGDDNIIYSEHSAGLAAQFTRFIGKLSSKLIDCDKLFNKYLYTS